VSRSALRHVRRNPFHVAIERTAVEAGCCEGRGDCSVVLQSASAAASTDEEEQEEQDRGSSQPNNQEDASNSTLVVEELRAATLTTVALSEWSGIRDNYCHDARAIATTDH